MKTVSVITRDSRLKERLLVDLTTLGYKALISSDESPDIIIIDDHELAGLRPDDLEKIVICVMGATANKHAELLSGIDDVLFSGYEIGELELRLRLALMKRGGFVEAKGPEKTLAVDGLTIDFDSYEVAIDNEPLDLTYKEYELLKCLITNKGRVYTRDQLLSIVWGYDYYGGARTVDVHIRRLRSKLGRHESLIETVRNVGYRFKR